MGFLYFLAQGVISMEKKKGQGFYLRLNKQESSYLLWKRKKCPSCGGKMKRSTVFVGIKLKKDLCVPGDSYRSGWSYIAPDKEQEMRVHTYHYTCALCDSTFSITELAQRQA